MADNSYKPTILFQRTPEEKVDPFLSWERSDEAFFASGACHILAYLFIQLHQNEGYDIVYIRPKDALPGSHVYVVRGEWVFDFNGWTKEDELISVTKEAYKKAFSNWDFDRIIVKASLEVFCNKNNHRLPYNFPYLPWARAYNYIQSFSKEPPVVS